MAAILMILFFLAIPWAAAGSMYRVDMKRQQTANVRTCLEFISLVTLTTRTMNVDTRTTVNKTLKGREDVLRHRRLKEQIVVRIKVQHCPYILPVHLPWIFLAGSSLHASSCCLESGK